MKKGERTRQSMIDAAAELLQRQGYHATGLKQVLDTAGAPRGSLYFHFPGGKEELACAALDDSGAAWRERLASVIEGASTPGAAILGVCRALADELEASDYANGCPLATVALEAATESELVRTTVAEHYGAWIRLIEARAVAAGIPERKAEDLATFVLAAVEGGLLLARVQRTTQPLLAVGRSLQQVFDRAA
jgi:TetR/AcrR family transcriptional regulator, lmrAB and yxaGH operons repressor